MSMGGIRQVATAALATGAVLLLGAACSGDDEGGDPTAPPEDVTTTTELTDEEFAERTEEFESGLEAAGTDFCAVVEAGSLSLDAEANSPERVEKAVDLYVMVMETLAGTEPIDPENSATLLASAQQLRSAAEASGYSVDFLSSEEAAEVLASEEFSEALVAYQQRALEECAPIGGGPPPPGDADAPVVEEPAAP